MPFYQKVSVGVKVSVDWTEGVNSVKAEVRKLSFPRSHLWDGTNTDTVDERTLKNLAFLQET